MSYEQSPGTYVIEYDESQTVVQVGTTTGVIVGEFDRGPVNERVLIVSEADLVNTFGKPNAKLGFACHTGVAFLKEATSLFVTRVAPHAKYGGCTISWDGRFNTSTPFLAGVPTPDDIDILANDLFVVYAKNPGDWNSELFVRVYPDTKTAEPYFFVELYLKGSGVPVERFRCSLRHELNGFGQQMNVEYQLNTKSNYVRVIQNHEQADLVNTPAKQLINTYDAGGVATSMGIALPGGSGGARPTMSQLINAWELYEDSEEVKVSLLINAGYEDTDYQRRMIEIAEDRMDCVAILDVPMDQQDAQAAISYRRNDLAVDSSYAALYSPAIYDLEEYSGQRMYLPCSGYVAAAYALTDRDYAEYFAPAGSKRGALNVSGLNKRYEKGHRNALYESQVNVIKIVNGKGIKIWGADTLQVMASALSNVSVRRLMIAIETRLTAQFDFSVFDPNDRTVRSKLTGLCNDVLQPMQDGRGLYWFGVTCDESNNIPATIAAGDLFVDIYVDPVLPVKRINFRAIVNRTGVRITAV